jgi:hypothetical protein
VGSVEVLCDDSEPGATPRVLGELWSGLGWVAMQVVKPVARGRVVCSGSKGKMICCVTLTTTILTETAVPPQA